MTKAKIISLYILLGLFTLCLTIIITFPVSKLAPIIAQTLSRQTKLQINITGLSPVFPAGIKASQITIQKTPFTPVQFSKINASLELFPLMLGHANTHILSHFWDGTLSVNTSANGIKNWSNLHLNLAASKLQLAHIIPYLNAPYIKKLRGLLSGRIELTLPAKLDFKQAQGNGTLDLADGATTFDAILLKNIAIQSVQAHLEFNLARNKLQITTGQIQAPGINGILNGNVILKDKPIASRLNLKINLNLKPEQKGFPERLKPFVRKKHLEIKLQGTPARPEMSVK